MSIFPGSIFSQRTIENVSGQTYDASKTTRLYAEDVTKLGDEVTSIETVLGANPQGAYATVLAWLTALASAVASIPTKATGAEINTGTNDTKFATPKAIADSDIAFLSDIPTLPVKATGSEVNTGTNDTKFVTPKAVADSNISFPDKTETLTNKRVTKRAPSITQSATPTINTDVTDVAHITALAQAITSMTTNLSGTPVQGDTLRIDITDNGTARAITWGSSFEASTIALPTTTVVSTRLDIGFVWNTVTTKWRCVGVA